MKSFNIKELWSEYILILQSFPRIESVIRFIIIPSIISLLLILFVEFDESITNIFGIIISILIGLLFSFVSTFSDKIPSTSLNQLAKEKIKRLKLVRETYIVTFIAILSSISSLILVFLIIITDTQQAQSNEIINCGRFLFNKLFSFLLSFVVYHLILLLILMINRLKKLLDIDVQKEMKFLEKERKKESKEWD